MSEKLRELQQGLKEEGADSFRRQVRKLGINALNALASELGVSVEGIRLKEEFASRVCAKIEVQESVARLRCVVQSGGTQGLWTQLKALKVQDIHVIAQELGLPTSGGRDALMKRLFDYISARDSGTTGAASPSSSSRRPELPEAGDDEQPLYKGSITEGVSVDSVGAVVWIGVFGGCSDSSLHCGSVISLLEFFPRASERRVLPIGGGLYLIFTSSHLHICSSSHLLIFTYSYLHTFSSSHLLIFTSAHLHICSSSHLLICTSSHSHLHTFSSSHLLIFTSAHLHICSSSHLLIFTSAHLHIFTPSHLHTFSHTFSSSHLLIFTPSHLHICSSSHLLIFTSAHLHICSSSHLHTFSSSHLLIFTSAHLHIFSSSHLLIFTSSHTHIFTFSLSHSHLHILTSSLLSLSLLFPLSFLSLPFLSLAFFIFLSLGRGWCRRGVTKRQPFRTK